VGGTAPAIVPESASATPAAGVRGAESLDRSAAYGAGLLKIANLERQRRRGEEAEAFYTKAIAVLGERAETAAAYLYLGIRRKNPEEAIAYLRTAERLDATQAGTARMWMALMRERERRGEEAEALYKSALAVEKAESAEAQSTLRLYARFLRQQGRSEEAEALDKQAASAMRRASPEASPGVFRVGNGVKPPALLRKLEPQYSEEARAAKYQGRVVVYAEIGTDGLAHNLRVLRGLGLGLDEKAIEAIDQWRFRPGSKDGTPVPVAATIEVNFRLL
jgi:TonB family protein